MKNIEKQAGFTAIIAASGMFMGVEMLLSFSLGVSPFAPEAIGRPALGRGFGPPEFAGNFRLWASTSSITAEQSTELQALQQETLNGVAPF